MSDGAPQLLIESCQISLEYRVRVTIFFDTTVLPGGGKLLNVSNCTSILEWIHEAYLEYIPTALGHGIVHQGFDFVFLKGQALCGANFYQVVIKIFNHCEDDASGYNRCTRHTYYHRYRAPQLLGG